jgi:hypothetical protein
MLRDIFKFAGIEDAIRARERPNKLSQLRRQYRMHKDIAEIVNAIAYSQFGEDFALETEEVATNNRWPNLLDKEPSKKSHVAFYDTSSRASVASQIDGGSYYNLYNALVCIQLATQAKEAGAETVGIISPYRAQVNLIQKMIADTDLGSIVVADTVHKFQGGQKQIVIFDITTPNTKTMYDNGKDDGADVRVLNVAISRAQDKCIFVGDIKQILKQHSNTSKVKRIIAIVSQKGHPVIDTETILQKYNTNDDADKWLAKIATIQLKDEMHDSELFDESNFYSGFIKDILSAKQEIIIDSPYITTKRVDSLLPFFEQAIRKGIKIFLLTRIATEQDENMRYYTEVEIERLSKLGITVLAFEGKIHHKIAIIDRRVLWEGSLNILSQRDSQEFMRRFEGAHSTKQMMGFLELDKNLGEMGSNSLRRCEFCKSPIAWYWTEGRRYAQTYCLLARHKQGVSPRSTSEQPTATNVTTPPACPEHHLMMLLREGPYGKFWGCPRFPTCRMKRKIV